MNGLPPNSHEPRYVQLAKTLLERISQGEFPVGELLPKEAELCESFQVSRTTVREALRIISEQGVVEKLHGIGTVVKTREPRRNFVVSVNSADLMQYGMETHLKMVDRAKLVTQPYHRQLFGCDTGETWYRIRGVRSPIEDEAHPIAFLEVYLPERFAQVAEQDMISNLPYHRRIVERYRIPVVGIEQEILAIAMSQEVAELLNSPAGDPALLVTRRFIGPGGQLIQASVNTHPSDRFSYRFYMNQVRY
ncbi:GntR family transcriptional regulator [Orrella marina]|uniref:GntR family transcriptional regulator n=1 Tax=Orrella marina TaxID=2163011 RepID=A0A2R4XGS3_9BURK|nr:GntR family transcriptional regulator [Orrella marina]AWB33005.1 GntR family transcriptional regulator [Orrella marina]